MSLNPFTAYSVGCDVCTAEVTGEDEETLWFTEPDEAHATARSLRWIVTADGRTICTEDDPDHASAVAELMPAEPEPEGQLALDDPTA